MDSWLKAFTRKKFIDPKTLTSTPLRRCLGILDLTFLGIGSTIGAGLYVLTGDVARNVAGPGVVVSYLIAAISSVLAGLCYAELGARVPKTGSCYLYSYIAIGELCAFLVGWNFIFDLVIGVSATAKASSSYLDALFDDSIKNFTISAIGEIHTTGIAKYPDLLAVVLILVLTLILLVGIKETSRFNTFLTALTIFPIVFIVCVGLYYADIKNWTDNFAPYGASGTLSGAATCFYAFTGFDMIANTGEEARNPGRGIPIAIALTLGICSLAYSGAASVLTLMCPYASIPESGAFVKVFELRGASWAKYIIGVGALCGLLTTLLTAMLPLPRILYAMASDGLIFKFFAKVNPTTEIPMISTVISGVLAALLALIFDLDELVEMLSIGILLSYAIVALCVLILRYQPENIGLTRQSSSRDDALATAADEENTLGEDSPLLPADDTSGPTQSTSSIARVCIGVSTIASLGLSAMLKWGLHALVLAEWWAIILVILIGLVLLGSIFLLFYLPQNKAPLAFKVPCIPVFPLVSVFVNLLLVLELSVWTWVRFAVMLAIGLIIYFAYGIRHSVEGERQSGDWPDLWNSQPDICLQKSQEKSREGDSLLEES